MILIRGPSSTPTEKPYHPATKILMKAMIVTGAHRLALKYQTFPKIISTTLRHP